MCSLLLLCTSLRDAFFTVINHFYMKVCLCSGGAGWVLTAAALLESAVVSGNWLHGQRCVP